MKIYLSILFFLFAGLILSQNSEDSLRTVWNNQSKADTTRIKALRLLIWENYMYDNPDTALKLSKDLTEFAESAGNDQFIANGYSMQGVALSLKGDFYASNEFFFKAKDIFLKLDYKLGLAAQYLNLGVNFKAFGEFPKAVDHFLEAEKIYGQLDNKQGIANCQNNVATIYMSQGDHDKAMALFDKVMVSFKELGDELGVVMAMTNKAMVFHHQGEHEKAEKAYLESIRIALMNEYKYELAQAYVGYSEVLMDLKKYDLAHDYMLGALELNKEISSQEDVALVYLNMCELYQLRDFHNKSIEAGKNALEISEAIGAKYISAQVYWRLYETYKKMNKTNDALKMHEDYLSAKIYMDSVENKEEVYRVSIEKEYEKKAEMDSLRNADEKLIQEAELSEAKIEKENQKIVTYALLAVLGIALLFGGFVYNRFQHSKKQNIIIQEQKEQVDHAYDELEQKNKEVLDSINYAKRIQSAILPPKQIVKSYLKDSFILYKPKDIVAGDFYWMEAFAKASASDGILFAAADCTGHGVPGAMVSVVCNNALNRAVREFGLTDPGKILDKTREIVIREFEHQNFEKEMENRDVPTNFSDQVIKDGMDIALVALSQNEKQNDNEDPHSESSFSVCFSGAHNPLWIIRKDSNEIEEIKGAKQPIGKFASSSPFPTHEVELNQGDTIYIFTDGYADQFGGEKGKKMKTANFKKLILEIQHLSMEEQREYLDKSFEIWKGDLEQLDDVCIIGVRV